MNGGVFGGFKEGYGWMFLNTCITIKHINDNNIGIEMSINEVVHKEITTLNIEQFKILLSEVYCKDKLLAITLDNWDNTLMLISIVR